MSKLTYTDAALREIANSSIGKTFYDANGGKLGVITNAEVKDGKIVSKILFLNGETAEMTTFTSEGNPS